MAYIEDRKFTRSSGKSYEVVGTRSTGWKAHDCIDQIKSLDTGKVVEMSRLRTLQFINS